VRKIIKKANFLSELKTFLNLDLKSKTHKETLQSWGYDKKPTIETFLMFKLFSEALNGNMQALKYIHTLIGVNPEFLLNVEQLQHKKKYDKIKIERDLRNDEITNQGR
jgi:hypothetical protein